MNLLPDERILFIFDQLRDNNYILPFALTCKRYWRLWKSYTPKLILNNITDETSDNYPNADFAYIFVNKETNESLFASIDFTYHRPKCSEFLDISGIKFGIDMEILFEVVKPSTIYIFKIEVDINTKSLSKITITMDDTSDDYVIYDLKNKPNCMAIRDRFYIYNTRDYLEVDISIYMDIYDKFIKGSSQEGHLGKFYLYTVESIQRILANEKPGPLPEP